MAAEKKINGSVYRFEEIVAWEAFDLLDLLLDVIGPLTPVLAAVMKDDEEQRNSELAAAIGLALQSRNKAAVRDMMSRLIDGCTVANEKCVVGVHPSTLDEMIQVSIFAAEAQFGRFFDGGALAPLINMVMAKAKAA